MQSLVSSLVAVVASVVLALLLARAVQAGTPQDGEGDSDLTDMQSWKGSIATGVALAAGCCAWLALRHAMAPFAAGVCAVAAGVALKAVLALVFQRVGNRRRPLP